MSHEQLYDINDICAIGLFNNDFDFSKSNNFQVLSQEFLKLIDSEETVLGNIDNHIRCKTSGEIKLSLNITGNQILKDSGIQCKKCLKYNVHYVLVQSRSADEAMIANYTCRDCKFTWKT